MPLNYSSFKWGCHGNNIIQPYKKGKKVKVYIYSPDIHVTSTDFYIDYPQVSEHTLSVSSSWEECSTFSAAEAIDTEPIIASPGTHYCWVARGSVDSKLAQGFYTTCIGAIEPQTSRPQVQHLNRSAKRSTKHTTIIFRQTGHRFGKIFPQCPVRCATLAWY